MHKSVKNGHRKEDTPYGRIKETTIGGIVMSREYRQISKYEKEILELKSQGLTHKEIGNRLGFSKESVKGFIKRYNAKQRKLAAGIIVRKKGRPSKNYDYQNLDSVTELKYILERKEAQIRRLEMENELMRDFLSLTERK